MAPTLKANPFGWLGPSISLYVDEDPFLGETGKSGKNQRLPRKALLRASGGVECEVKNPLGLAAFLTALRALFRAKQAPGLTKWENRDYNGQTYVKVSTATPDEESGKWAVYYAVTPKDTDGDIE